MTISISNYLNAPHKICVQFTDVKCKYLQKILFIGVCKSKFNLLVPIGTGMALFAKKNYVHFKIQTVFEINIFVFSQKQILQISPKDFSPIPSHHYNFFMKVDFLSE